VLASSVVAAGVSSAIAADLENAVVVAGVVFLAVAAERAGVAAKAVGELESVENMTVAR
jgi:hypothetical protein